MPDYKKNKEIFESFISEALDLIEGAEKNIGRLEKENEDDELVNGIFRTFHSMKSTSAFLHFNNISKLAHEAEAFLDIFRKKEATANSQDVDLLYAVCDLFRAIISQVETQQNDDGFEDRVEDSISRIRNRIESIKKKESVVAAETQQLSEKHTDFHYSGEAEKGGETLNPAEIVEKYISESLEILDYLESTLIELEKNPFDEESVAEIFRRVHSFKGNSGFLGYMDIESLASEVENLLEKIRDKETAINSIVTRNLLEIADAFRNAVNTITPEKIPSSIKINYKEQLIDNLINLKQVKPKAGVFHRLGEILVEMGETTEKAVEEALDKQMRPLGQILVEEGIVSNEAIEKALEVQKKELDKGKDAINITNIRRRDIRVDTSKLDKLFNLIGELIIAEAMVTHNSELEGLQLTSFHKASNNLSKITREIHEISMSIRMVPVEGLFTKMTRVVRDLCHKSNKKIDLNITGSDTEMDKNVIEELSDPLVHMLRNAIDHGIETAENRIAAGKHEEGKITLSAHYEGNEIWIVVEDDGGGLNREKILARAAEKGMLTREPEKMTDNEVWQFIMEPGFSTADKVTDISGRGVGMDVVKKNIEKLRGRLEIYSSFGRGTRFIIRIPLTLAIIDGMVVQVGENKYAVPISEIVQSMKIQQEQIVHTEEMTEVIRVREEMIPIVRLHSAFKINTEMTGLTDGIIVIVQCNGKKYGLFVDHIIGSQQIVVKSMPEFMGRVNGVMGCSIMARGEIGLILDVNGLVGNIVE